MALQAGSVHVELNSQFRWPVDCLAMQWGAWWWQVRIEIEGGQGKDSIRSGKDHGWPREARRVKGREAQLKVSNHKGGSGALNE